MEERPIAPEWSHELALLAQSPVWNGLRGQKAKDAFMDEAARYDSYDELPTHLKSIYRKAYRQLPGHSRKEHA